MEPLNHKPALQSALTDLSPACAWHRRQFLGAALGAGLTSFLTPVSHLLARQAEGQKEPAQSLIVLWLGGGPSQLETFDPHPGTDIAHGSLARDTKAKGVQLAAGFEQLADQMDGVALVRSLVSKEGDHERGTYTMRTGFRPDPTVIHPAIGAVLCYELPVGTTEIPRHVAILPGQWPPRGGFLGDEFDAFKMVDPKDPVPDVAPRVPTQRDEERTARSRRHRARLRPGPGGARQAHAAHGDGRERSADDEFGADQGFRRHARTGGGAACLRRHAVRPRLPGGPAVDRGRRPLRRGDAERLGQPRRQPCASTRNNWRSSIRRSRRCCATCANASCSIALWWCAWASSGGRRRSIRWAAATTGPTASASPWPADAFAAAPSSAPPIPKGRKTPQDKVSVGDLHATLLTAVGLDPNKVNASKIGRTVRLAEGEPVAKLLS